MADLSSAPKIEIRGLTKSFGKKQVLRGIDLDIHSAQSVVIIGGSGSGKSVLLKCILGLIEADAGSIRIDDMDGSFPFRDIGVVLHPTKKDEHVAGLRPRGLEVVVTSGERFALGLTVGVDVDFAVHVIRASIGFIPDCGSASGDMGEDPDERGSSVGHLGIDTAFLFPEFADQGLLF